MSKGKKLTGRDWSIRYALGRPTWDLGGPHPELVARLTDDPSLGVPDDPRRALVPGCGLGHDAEALAKTGWRVTAVDFAYGLESEVRGRFGPLGCRFVADDALTFQDDELYDLLFDHTFFCALHPEDRPAFGDLARRLVKPGGRICSIVFPAEKQLEAGGPPWGMTAGDLSQTLGVEFVMIEGSPVSHCGHPSWGEYWVVFARR
jgi:SAM-dependent methyltransferase